MSFPSKKIHSITGACLLGALLLVVGIASAQDSGSDSAQQASSAPLGTFGQEAPPPPASEFPPLSGLDEATLEPNIAARSFLQPGFQISEHADSNAQNSLRGPGNAVVGITRLQGDALLERLWSRYQVGLGYVGSGAFHNNGVIPNSQAHVLDFDSRLIWRTGTLQLLDSASYLPEGTFGGGGFGGIGGLGLGGLGGGILGGGVGGTRFNFLGGGMFGALGTVPRVNNLSILGLEQNLSPRTAFTLTGAYNLVHFTRNTAGLLIDSRQISGQAGYDYILNRRNRISLAYGFQQFSFPTVNGGKFQTHLLHLIYGHQVSGRMELTIGGGPQVTRLSSPLLGVSLKVSASARASLRYRLKRASLALSYNRYDSSGSGIYAGAITDLVRFTVTRPLARRWNAMADIGYSHNKRLQQISQGINSGSYDYGYAGGRLDRIIGRSWRGFLFYQFNDLNFGSSFCGGSGPCSRTSTRHNAGIGLSWHPHAIRLD